MRTRKRRVSMARECAMTSRAADASDERSSYGRSSDERSSDGRALIVKAGQC